MKEFRQHNQGAHEKYRYTFFYYQNNYEVYIDLTGRFHEEDLTEDRIDDRNNDSFQILIIK